MRLSNTAQALALITSWRKGQICKHQESRTNGDPSFWDDCENVCEYTTGPRVSAQEIRIVCCQESNVYIALSSFVRIKACATAGKLLCAVGSNSSFCLHRVFFRQDLSKPQDISRLCLQWNSSLCQASRYEL